MVKLLSNLKVGYFTGQLFAWMQVHNLVPVLIALLSIAILFYTINSRLEQLNLNFQYLDAKFELTIKQRQIAEKNVKGVATSSAILSPTLPVKKIK